MNNKVALSKAGLNGQLRLMPAEKYSLSDGELLGFLDPEIFSPDDLYEMYSELASNEDFEVEPLNYSGTSFNKACEIARQTHPGGWGLSNAYGGYVCYNGAYPFKAGGKWYSIYFYWADLMDI